MVLVVVSPVVEAGVSVVVVGEVSDEVSLVAVSPGAPGKVEEASGSVEEIAFGSWELMPGGNMVPTTRRIQRIGYFIITAGETDFKEDDQP